MAGSVECNAELLKCSPEANVQSSGKGGRDGARLAAPASGAAGPHSNRGHHPRILRFGFSSSSLYQINFLELVVEKEAATLRDLFQSGLGRV